MRSDPSSRRPSAVLGRISGLPADCSTVRVESSFRQAFWADVGVELGRFGASFGADRTSKITLPLMREHDFRFFVPTRAGRPSDRLLDLVWGPLGAVLDRILGLLGLFWALLGPGSDALQAPMRRERAFWTCLGPWSWSRGPSGGLLEASGALFGLHFGPISVHDRRLQGS